jgi:hypothetical protein
LKKCRTHAPIAIIATRTSHERACPYRKGKVVRDHGEDDREGQVVVVHRAPLGFEAGRGVRIAPGPLRRDELAVRRDDVQEDVPGHDRPEHGADLDVGAAAAEELARAVRSRHGERGDRGREHELPAAERSAEDVVDDPGGRKQADARADRLPLAQGRDVPVDEIRLRVRVVEDDEEREAREPGGVRLPLEPVERLGEPLGRDPVLLDVVEAAAVHRPVLATDSAVFVLAPPGRLEREVEVDEVERGSDPRDPGDHVQPADGEVQPVAQVRVHGACEELTARRRVIGFPPRSGWGDEPGRGDARRAAATARLRAARSVLPRVV